MTLDPRLAERLMLSAAVTLTVIAVIVLDWLIYLVLAALHRRLLRTPEQQIARWHRQGYADGFIYEGADQGICPICKPLAGAVSLTMTGALKIDDWSAGECTTCHCRFILPHRGDSYLRFFVHETYQTKRKCSA
jgi:hypothetical protein